MMLKQFSAAFAAILFGATAALAQIPGQFPAGTVYGNSGASTARPAPSTVTAIIDQALGNTRGSVLERGASGWTPLTPGTVNLPLLSGGAGADPAYAKLPVAGGGTNCTAASITCIQNILGTIAANAVLANVTGGSANATAFVMPGCASDGAHALIYTNGTGFLCQTLTLGSTVIAPQGRLTLTSNTPVLKTNTTAQATVYYDCYVGNLVPYYTGSSDALDTIPSCEKSMLMIAGATTTTGNNSADGGVNNNGVFDIWWEGNTSHNICIANGKAAGTSGGGWAQDTGAPSNTARGTGYSQLDTTTRPYITNANTITNCWNNSSNLGPITANKGTYLATIYTTVAGQTGMAFSASSAGVGTGGGNNTLGVFNAYNRVRVEAYSQDTTSTWSYGSLTWHAVNASTNNQIRYVDGLAHSVIDAQQTSACTPGIGHGCQFGVNRDSTSATPTFQNLVWNNSNSAAVRGTFLPLFGLHAINAVENTYDTTAATFYGSGWGGGAGQTQTLMIELFM